ncbi:cytochrome c oxidase assembly protein COX16-domain-containing protein [Gongronella butleri]|nr:cytochrome c oxidase assembly protein COX16-domain-containing protein [Gongronella butleri]
MPTFQSKSFARESQINSLSQKVKRHPFVLFGLPFIGIIVGASVGLSQLTQTKFDHRDMRHKKVEKEEALGIDKSKRKLSIQEEYWRLQSKTEDDWEQVRIERPANVDNKDA